jgi:hypothetical protein
VGRHFKKLDMIASEEKMLELAEANRAIAAALAKTES